MLYFFVVVVIFKFALLSQEAHQIKKAQYCLTWFLILMKIQSSMLIQKVEPCTTRKVLVVVPCQFNSLLLLQCDLSSGVISGANPLEINVVHSYCV